MHRVLKRDALFPSDVDIVLLPLKHCDHRNFFVLSFLEVAESLKFLVDIGIFLALMKEEVQVLYKTLEPGSCYELGGLGSVLLLEVLSSGSIIIAPYHQVFDFF
jgi:hypothetical protein